MVVVVARLDRMALAGLEAVPAGPSSPAVAVGARTAEQRVARVRPRRAEPAAMLARAAAQEGLAERLAPLRASLAARVRVVVVAMAPVEARMGLAEMAATTSTTVVVVVLLLATMAAALVRLCRGLVARLAVALVVEIITDLPASALLRSPTLGLIPIRFGTAARSPKPKSWPISQRHGAARIPPALSAASPS